MTLQEKFIWNTYTFQYPDPPWTGEALKAEAEKGNAEAQFHYAWTFAEADFRATVYWIQKSAELNFPPALRTFSSLLMEGTGMPKNVGEAFRFVQSAYNLDPKKSAAALGYFYLRGIFVRKDPARAVALFQEGAEAEEPAAIVNLGYCYLMGQGVPRDPNRGYMLTASQLGKHPVIPANLGYCYMIGLGVKKDYAQALQFSQEAADLGCKEAICNIGILYLRGWGVKKNTKRAVEYFRLAAESGDPTMSYNLGVELYKRWHLFQSIPYLWRGGKLGMRLLLYRLIVVLFFGYFLIHAWYNSPLNPDFENRLTEQTANPLIGTDARIGGTFVDGSEYRAEDYAGKVVLLDFWATWCAPCRRDIQTHLLPLYEKYHEQGFEIIGISCDDEAQTVREYAQAHKIPWKHLLNAGAVPVGQQTLGEYYGAHYIPYPVLVGRDGKIVSLDMDAESLEIQIQNELAKNAEE